MKQATFNIRIGRGLEQKQGYVTALPHYPAVIVALHKDGGSVPWVCSEYETGAVLADRCPRREDAIRDAEFTIEMRGLERILAQRDMLLETRGRANTPRTSEVNE